MKPLFIVLAFFALSCSNDKKTSEVASSPKDTAKTEDINYPYSASYSSNFEKGDPKNAKIILDLWKDFDNNDLDRGINQFADTITIIFPDGNLVRASKDSILAIFKNMRGGFSSVKSSVSAWVPLRIADKDEDWVAVWGSEVYTSKKGKTDSMDIHEIWRINKNDKIDFWRQFEAKPVKAK